MWQDQAELSACFFELWKNDAWRRLCQEEEMKQIVTFRNTNQAA